MPSSERSFFHPEARARVTAAIKEVEAQTSAEVVVAVRRAAASYRDVDYLVGFACAMAVLLVLLFDPHEFAVEGMPLGVAGGFAAGAVASAKLAWVRRALTSGARRDAACLAAARAAFVELGVGRTRERRGMIVVVFALERRARLVADVGIDGARLGAEWAARVAALESSLAGGLDVGAFVEALRALGPVLGATMPHRPDDVNELPDEVA